MTQQELFDFFVQHHIAYTVFEHEPLFTVGQAEEVERGTPTQLSE